MSIRRSKRIETAIRPGKMSVNAIDIVKTSFEINQMAAASTNDTSGSIGGTKKEAAAKLEETQSGCLGFGDNLFRYQCSVCNSKTASLRSLLNHRQSVHNITQRSPLKNVDLEPDFNDPNHYCKSCEKHLIAWPTYRRHLRIVHHLSAKSLQQKIRPESVTPDPSGPDYRCSSCNLACQNQQAYQEHMKKHSEMKPSTASACNSHDELPDDYNNPSRHCASCNFTYASKKTYIQHYRNMHTTKPPRYSARSTTADFRHSKLYCKVCRLNFKTAEAFKRHSDRVHEPATFIANPEIKPTVMNSKYHCKACEKSYISLSHYQRHLQTRLHQVNCNCYCYTCDKKLSGSGSFTRHLFLIHSIRQPGKEEGRLQPDVNDRNNYCRVCQRSYNDSVGYRGHLRAVHQMTIQALGSKDSKTRPIRKNTQRSMALDYRKISNPDAVIDINSPIRYCAQCERSYRNKFAFTSHLKAAHDILI